MMARGGTRPGAGRPKGAGASPTATNSIREKIKTNQIIERLHRFVNGECEMQPAAVTAGLGLLRKVLPDLAAVTHSGQVELKRASEMTDDELAAIAAHSSDGTAEAKEDTPQLH